MDSKAYKVAAIPPAQASDEDRRNRYSLTPLGRLEAITTLDNDAQREIAKACSELLLAAAKGDISGNPMLDVLDVTLSSIRGLRNAQHRVQRASHILKDLFRR
jgi:hypothetical protein